MTENTLVGLVIAGGSLFLISVVLMFATENTGLRWWLRLPFINLIVYAFLFILGCIEEVYLTFHPHERTTYIKTSIFQKFFE